MNDKTMLAMASTSHLHQHPHHPALHPTRLLTLTLATFLAFTSSSSNLIHAAPPSSSSTPLLPNPVGAFAICQTPSSVHIQGGVGYNSQGTFLITTNQHFRLDLSQSFSYSASPAQAPTWANLTSDYSPFQRFHSGACTPNHETFLTVGNAEAQGGSGFMMAYSVLEGKWNEVSQAVSGATNSNSDGGGGGKGKGGNSNNNNGAGISAAGRTMSGFALGTNGTLSSKGTMIGGMRGMGVVVGGGWLAPSSSSSGLSVQATDLVNLVTEVDQISVDEKGDLESLVWNVAPNTGHGGSNINSNLGEVAGAKVLILPGGTKALVLGGVTKQGGMSFGTVPIVDMATGAVNLQKTQSTAPTGRYGHCAALSGDGNTVYLFGGSLTASNRITNELFALDIRTWTWFTPSIKGTMPPPVRDHQCVMVGDQFISLLGFNANQAPASSSRNPDSPSPIPPPPMVYVLSTSQLSWTNQYTPLPGTPTPPMPPNVPTDGNHGKISGAGIAFAVIFGLAFVGVIGFLVYSHRRKQRRKAETLVLVELEQKRKQEEKEEKERKKQFAAAQAAAGDYNGDLYGSAALPPVPSSPMAAHMYHHHQQQQSYHGQDDGLSDRYYQDPVNPFQDQSYQSQHHPHLHQQQYQQQPTSLAASVPPVTSMGYYAQATGPRGGERDRNPFAESEELQYLESTSSPIFVPEEMGHSSSPSQDRRPVHHQPHYQHQQQSLGFVNGGGGGRVAGDKTSFIEPGSSYR